MDARFNELRGKYEAAKSKVDAWWVEGAKSDDGRTKLGKQRNADLQALHDASVALTDEYPYALTQQLQGCAEPPK